MPKGYLSKKIHSAPTGKIRSAPTGKVFAVIDKVYGDLLVIPAPCKLVLNS